MSSVQRRASRAAIVAKGLAGSAIALGDGCSGRVLSLSLSPLQKDRRSAGGRSPRRRCATRPSCRGADLMRENLLLLHPPQQVKEEPNLPPDLRPPPTILSRSCWMSEGRLKEGGEPEDLIG